MIVATPPLELARANPLVVRQVGQRIGRMGHGRHIGSARAACHCFSCGALPIFGADEHFSGVGRPRPRPVRRHQGSMGAERSGGDEPPRRRRQGRRPVGRAAAAARGRRSRRAPASPRSTSCFAAAARASAAAAAGFRGRPDRSLIVWAILGFILIWLVFTSVHSISPGQRGVVTPLRPLQPHARARASSLTLPSPIDRVKKIDVENIRNDRSRLAKAPTI